MEFICRQSVMIEKSWNVAVRNMFGLSVKTHRYLIEPISGTHIKSILMKRFLTFLLKIRKGNKVRVKHLLETIQNDCRSVTGNNLRQIMLLTNKTKISFLSPSDTDNIRYYQIPKEEEWRIGCILDIVDTLNRDATLTGFEEDELKKMLTFICES